MGYFSLYFIFLFFVSDFNSGHSSGSWKSLDLIIDRNGTCDRLLHNFSLAARNFTYCSITNARPITFCENCVRYYLDVLKYHEEILTVQDRGVKCKDALINVDRLEIIETLYSSFVQLWKKGECDYCFEIEPNGTTTYTLNNSTINFHAIEKSVRECIEKNMEKNSTVCTLCREPYKKLNDFYNSLKQSSRVCMDIVDSMNASRMEWSKDLGCKLHFGMDPYLITTAVLFTFIPGIFYGLVKKYSSRVESRLLYHSQQNQGNVSISNCRPNVSMINIDGTKPFPEMGFFDKKGNGQQGGRHIQSSLIFLFRNFLMKGQLCTILNAISFIIFNSLLKLSVKQGISIDLCH